MPKKSLNIEEAVLELRAETARPEARLSALRALRACPRSFSLRWVALGVAVSALGLPLVCRTPGSQSMAASWDQVIKATTNAPIMHITAKQQMNGKSELVFERWTAGNMHRTVARVLGKEVEFRNDGKVFYSRRENMEVVSRLAAKSMPTSDQSVYTLDRFLRETKPESVKGSEHITVDGKEIDRYRIEEHYLQGISRTQIVDVQSNTRRVVRIHSDVKEGWSEISIQYPDSITYTIFSPPAISRWPRFDLEREHAAFMRDLKMNPLKGKFKNATTQLLPLTQSPDGTLEVGFMGVSPHKDGNHPALIFLPGDKKPLRPFPYLGSMQNTEPSLDYSHFELKQKVERLDVKVPVYRKKGSDSQFVGYALFRKVKVRQSLPLSHYWPILKTLVKPISAHK